MRFVNVILFGILFILYNSCPTDDNRCIFCNGPVCLFCLEGFTNPSNGKCVQTKSIKNCLSYINQNECRTCVSGFYLLNNSCVAIPDPQCFEYDKNNKCVFCKNKILQTNGNCNSNKKCSINYCKLCKGDVLGETCGQCQSGYVLSVSKTGEFSCIPQTSNTEFCMRKINNADVCAICLISHSWNNGRCISNNLGFKPNGTNSNDVKTSNSSDANKSKGFFGKIFSFFGYL